MNARRVPRAAVLEAWRSMGPGNFPGPDRTHPARSLGAWGEGVDRHPVWVSISGVPGHRLAANPATLDLILGHHAPDSKSPFAWEV